jgi:hypothetical protein
MNTILQATQRKEPCTIVTVYNIEGEVVHKQFVNCDHLSPQQIANEKKFMEGIYYILIQNRSMIRMERMIIH